MAPKRPTIGVSCSLLKPVINSRAESPTILRIPNVLRISDASALRLHSKVVQRISETIMKPRTDIERYFTKDSDQGWTDDPDADATVWLKAFWALSMAASASSMAI